MERISRVEFEAHSIPVVRVMEFRGHFSSYMQQVYDGSYLAIERGDFVSGVLVPKRKGGYKEITDKLYLRFCREMRIETDSIGEPSSAQLEFFYERFGDLGNLSVNRINYHPEFFYQLAHLLNIAEYRGEDNFDAYTIITKTRGRGAKKGGNAIGGKAILVPPSVGLEIIVNKAHGEIPKKRLEIAA